MEPAGIEEAFFDNGPLQFRATNFESADQLETPLTRNLEFIPKEAAQYTATWKTLKADLSLLRTDIAAIEKQLTMLKDAHKKKIAACTDLHRLLSNMDIFSTYTAYEKIIQDIFSTTCDKLNAEKAEKMEKASKCIANLAQLSQAIQLNLEETMSEEERQQFKTAGMCGICIDNPVNIVFIPCGHTICSPCHTQSSSRFGQCHICRKSITSSQRVFFS